MEHAADQSGRTQQGGYAMFGRAGSEPKLLFPGLAGFYATVSDLWYPMIRVVFGACLLFHGWGKVAAGNFTVGPSLAKYGIEPHTALGYVVVFIETIGALCIILGLGTRFFAAAAAIEMAVIAFKVKMPAGFGQMEMFILFGIVFFAIALRGGGPYSLDRKIAKEL
jgi:putative oxidoreductase